MELLSSPIVWLLEVTGWRTGRNNGLAFRPSPKSGGREVDEPCARNCFLTECHIHGSNIIASTRILFFSIFKVFIEFVTIVLLFYVLVFFFILAPRHVGSSFPSKDQTLTPCIGRQSLNHWTTGKF